MKRFRKTKATGKQGVAFVEQIVFGAGSIFREVPEDTDVGIDGYIEFVEQEIATGTLVSIQIKTGSSYIRRKAQQEHFAATLSKYDVQYLHAHQLPVALIFFEPDSGFSGWIDITGTIRSNPDLLQEDHVTFSVGIHERPFSISDFETNFKTVFRSYKISIEQAHAIELMVSLSPTEKYLGFVGLMSTKQSRFTKTTCFLLAHHIKDSDNYIRMSVSDSLSRYLSHPEAGFVPPQEIRQYVEDTIKSFGREEVYELIVTASLDEENLMQRGSIGQSIGVIVVAIPKHEDILYDIISDRTIERQIRFTAMALAHEFGIEETVQLVASNFSNFFGDELMEEASWLVELAQEYDSHDEEVEYLAIDELSPDTYNSNDYALIIENMNFITLLENERELYKILFTTNNGYVRFIAGRILNDIMRYKEKKKRA